MRFLILNSDYPLFLSDLYERERGLAERSFDEQLRTRMDTLFGVADFYSHNLRQLGHQAHDVIVNNEALQGAWAREHGFAPHSPWGPQVTKSSSQRLSRGAVQTRLHSLGHLLSRARRVPVADTPWFYPILERQIEHFRPDILLNQDIGMVKVDFLKRLRSHYGLLVGQIASPIPTGQAFASYDLMLSSLPNLVEQFRRAGVRAELHRLGFDQRVLEQGSPGPRALPLSFVGQISTAHVDRLRLLEMMSEQGPLEVWGFGMELVPEDSPVRSRYRGRAWGADMYRILRQSKMTLNKHLDVAGPHANNMRLYEATGSGALLLTDAKDDLAEVFTPGEEVVTYSSAEECRVLAAHYLHHSDEREAIALAGQRRTLADHTYERRMSELVEIVDHST
jgi:spore maturation protein CgeB